MPGLRLRISEHTRVGKHKQIRLVITDLRFCRLGITPSPWKRLV